MYGAEENRNTYKRQLKYNVVLTKLLFIVHGQPTDARSNGHQSPRHRHRPTHHAKPPAITATMGPVRHHKDRRRPFPQLLHLLQIQFSRYRFFIQFVNSNFMVLFSNIHGIYIYIQTQTLNMIIRRQFHYRETENENYN